MISKDMIEKLLEEGTDFLESKEFAKAIECFDDVLFYDPCNGQALIGKSRALYGQKHFVKSLRYYERGVNSSGDLEDNEYHKLLLAKSGEEIDAFPKMKREIYAGDECFAKGEYENALENYKKALANTSSEQKEKILFRLLNKTATAYLKLNDFESAFAYFNESLNALDNDYAYFGKGLCEYELKLAGACESLMHAVKLTKEQVLEKGLVLNELGCYSHALETFDFLLENHFRQDEIYVKAINGKELAESKLGLN